MTFTECLEGVPENQRIMGFLREGLLTMTVSSIVLIAVRLWFDDMTKTFVMQVAITIWTMTIILYILMFFIYTRKYWVKYKKLKNKCIPIV